MRSRSFWAFISAVTLLLAGCQRGSQTGKGAPEGDNASGSGAKLTSVLELGCVPADCFAAVVIRPQRILKSPQAAQSAEVKKLLESEGYQELVKQIGFDFRDLEEVTFLVLAPVSLFEEPPAPAVVLRFAQPIARDQIIGNLAGKEYARSAQTHAGKTYYKFSPPKERQYARPTFFWAPDDRTLVLVEREEEMLKKMLEANAEGPLADALRRADMGHDLVGVAVMQPARKFVDALSGALAVSGPPEFRDAKSLAGQLKRATIVGDVFGNPLAKAVVETDSPDAAAKLLPMAQKGRELLLQELRSSMERRAKLERKPRESDAKMDDLAAQFLDVLSLSQRDAGLEAVVRMKDPELAFWLIHGPIEAQREIKPILAKIEVSNLRAALQRYRTAAGSYPTTEQGLLALVKRPADLDAKVQWNGPYMGRLEKDPWSRDYQYRYPAKRGNPDQPEIWSNGPDGKSDTPDDIGTWDPDGSTGPGPGRGRLSGTVKFQGKPVTRGIVILSDEEHGVFMTASIQADGTFAAKTAEGPGIWAGKYRVAVAPPLAEPQMGVSKGPPSIPAPPDIPPKYWKPETSGLMVEVKEGQNDPFHIDMKP